MGRTLMYTAIGGLLIIVLSSVFLLDHGGARIPQPNSLAAAAEAGEPDAEIVSLHDLTAQVERYEGRTVSTTGTLFFNSATNQFVVHTDNANYDVVIDYAQKLGRFEGEVVRVIGKFIVIPGEGPTIEATDVSLLDA
jgi:hypothetical protein